MNGDTIVGNINNAEIIWSCVYCTARPIISFGIKLAINTFVHCPKFNDTYIYEKVLTPDQITNIIEVEWDISKCTRISGMTDVRETISGSVDDILWAIY